MAQKQPHAWRGQLLPGNQEKRQLSKGIKKRINQGLCLSKRASLSGKKYPLKEKAMTGQFDVTYWRVTINQNPTV
jgi:hypothetical protein